MAIGSHPRAGVATDHPRGGIQFRHPRCPDDHLSPPRWPQSSRATINGVLEPVAKDASAVRHVLLGPLLLVLLIVAGCGGGTHPTLGPTPPLDRVLVSGTATVDGTEF